MLTFLYVINESKEQEVCSFWEVVDSLYALQTTVVVVVGFRSQEVWVTAVQV